MHPLYLAFLIAFTLFASVHASHSPTFVVEDENKGDIDSRRFLNANSAVNEERLPQLPTSSIEKIKSFTTPATISDDIFNRWVKEKKSVDKVFVRLNLKTTKQDKLVENPHFVTWIKYVKALDAKTEGPSSSAVSKLTEYYGDRVVAQIIEGVKIKPGMEKLASDLQTQQFQYWLHQYMSQTPDGVFRSLGLGFEMAKLLENPSKNPLFMTWINYVKFYNKHAKIDGYLPTLGAKFRYNDNEISRMVEVARKTPSTMEFAKKLRAEQVDRWFTYGWHPSKVWLNLRHDVDGKNVFASPEFKLLSTYVDRFNTKYPDKKITVVSALNEYYRSTTSKAILTALRSKTPDITNQVEAALIKLWLTKYDPTQVFKILNLQQSRTKLLKNPLLITWGKYVYAFNMKYPNKRTTPMEILRNQFGEKKLYKMLVLEKNVPSS